MKHSELRHQPRHVNPRIQVASPAFPTPNPVYWTHQSVQCESVERFHLLVLIFLWEGRGTNEF